MSLLDAINAAIVLIGVPTIATVLVSAGKKLQKLDTLDKTIEREIKPDLQDVRERFATLEGRVSEYTKANSPVSLTEKGEKLLRESGFKKYIDDHKEELLTFCKENFKLDTAYDIQEAIFDHFENMEIEPEYEKRIKEYAYKDGASMAIVRRVGAIYFRDICLERFEKDGKDIDQRESSPSTPPTDLLSH